MLLEFFSIEMDMSPDETKLARYFLNMKEAELHSHVC